MEVISSGLATPLAAASRIEKFLENVIVDQIRPDRRDSKNIIAINRVALILLLLLRREAVVVWKVLLEKII